MAYNLQPLITILEQILNPQQTLWIVDHNKPQLESLLQKAASLQLILEKSPLTKIESLESQIREVAHKAEDIIESHMLDRMLSRLGNVILDHNKPKPKPKPKSLLKIMAYNLRPLTTNLKKIFNPKTEDTIESHTVDQILCNPKGVSLTFSTPDLQKVMQELDSVMEQVVKLIEEKATSSGVSFSHDMSSKSIVVHEEHPVQSKAVVGVDEDLRQLMDRVMGMQSKLEIVPIVGMGGIGKTTLARKLYQDPAVVEHFTSLAWTTISQDYNMQAILLSLLRCIIGKECDQHTRKESHELKEILYRSLYGRRYIIVLDDIWSIRFWDEIRMYLPDNNNGSRIVITTRETQVAEHANSHGKQHEMQLLNESESWNLLRQEAFGDEEDCPATLERTGRNIAINCGGLPLAISVIGGILSTANKSEDVWENVANDVRAAIAESDGQLSDILSLSYNHLSSHLRPCFLYMGAFPEDYEIKASRLIRLWVAEGFLKSKGEKSLEEEAEVCLKALVDRNVLSIKAIKYDGRVKSYIMHDLMRDLCLKKMEEQRFIHIDKKHYCLKIEGIRRVSIHSSIRDTNPFCASGSMSSARSFLHMGPRWGCDSSEYFPSDVLLDLRLLRVLDLFQMEFVGFPRQILQIVNLCYLAISFSYAVTPSYYAKLPSDISRLRNLQTLIIYDGSIYLPREILLMAELRHVVVHRGEFVFWYGDLSDWGGFFLDKLQTFVSISLKSSHGLLYRIPNVKKLGITDSLHLLDLYYLHKLETLRLSDCKSEPILPPSLKKLCLRNCSFDSKFMKYLCELPNLEVLKIKDCKLEDWKPWPEWNATEQQFCKLKCLLLERVELVDWPADETNFPRLRHLVIRRCPTLEEIPSGIGEIPTLQTIELDKYNGPSLVASAKLIIEEQRENGNNDLQLRM